MADSITLHIEHYRKMRDQIVKLESDLASANDLNYDMDAQLMDRDWPLVKEKIALEAKLAASVERESVLGEALKTIKNIATLDEQTFMENRKKTELVHWMDDIVMVAFEALARIANEGESK